MQYNNYEPASSPFTSALLLTDREASAVIDRQALRAIGVTRVRLATSGAIVAKAMALRVSRVLLEENEIVICLPKLADMNAAQFATLVRSHPLLVHIPMLAVSSEPGQEKALKERGFNAVIARPFNSTTLLNKLFETRQSSEQAKERLLVYLAEHPGVPSSEQFEENLQAYDLPDSASMSPIEALRHGMELAREHEWELALPFLQRAVSDPRTRGDASLLLSVYWRASGDEQKVYDALCDSLAGYLESARWDKARSIAKKLLEEYPGRPSPILNEIVAKAKRNQYDTVLKLLPIAQEVAEPSDIAEAIATGCKLSLTPAQTLPTLGKMLEEAGYVELAAELTPPPPAAGKNAKPKQPFLWFKAPKKRLERENEQDKELAEVAAQIYDEPYPHTAWQEGSPEVRDDPAPTRKSPAKASAGGAEFGQSGPVIAPLGFELGSNELTPSALGDAWTIVKGTVLMNKKKRPKDDEKG